MKRIGIFSGSFDPPTKGHMWVIEQMEDAFDTLHFVLGHHGGKSPTYSTEDRLAMMCYATKNMHSVEVSKLRDNENIIGYARRIAHGRDVTLIRSVRDSSDYEYEAGICKYIQANCDFRHVYLFAPEFLIDVSSSRVRTECVNNEWNTVYKMVPFSIFECLQCIHKCAEHPNPKVQEMFTVKDKVAELKDKIAERGIYIQSCGSHHLNLVDFGDEDELAKMRENFERITKAGFIEFPKQVTADQVRAMLDPVPIDVVVSENFHLRKIPIASVNPTGDRYIERSCSLGPIIVERNINIGPLVGLGPVIIIEGKHRWLDAQDRGEEFIWAWVGDTAMGLLGV